MAVDVATRCHKFSSASLKLFHVLLDEVWWLITSTGACDHRRNHAVFSVKRTFDPVGLQMD